jgi:hypothetical protein
MIDHDYDLLVEIYNTLISGRTGLAREMLGRYLGIIPPDLA